MNFNWLLSVFLSVLLLLFSLFMKYQQKSWLAPCVLFSTFLSIVFLLSLIILPDAHYYPSAFAWYILAVGFFYSGNICGNIIVMVTANHNTKITIAINKRGHYYCLRRAVRMATWCFFLGLCGVLVLIRSAGSNILSLFKPENLIDIARMYSVARYEDPFYREPILATLLIVFMYTGNLLGGYIYAISKKRSFNIIALLTLLPNILVGLVSTARAGLLFGLILWVAAFISTKVPIDFGKIKFINKKNVTSIITIIAMVIIFLITVRTFRSGKIENFNIVYFQQAIKNLYVAVFGSIPAFNIFFDQGISHGFDGPSLGSYSFGGPLSLFGIERKAFLPVDIGGGYAQTTIHSIFGALIMDFSLIGSLLFLFLLGTFSGALFKMARRGHINYGVILTPIYIYIEGSLNNSVLKFNNMNLGILIFVGYLFLLHRRYYYSKPPLIKFIVRQ